MTSLQRFLTVVITKTLAPHCDAFNSVTELRVHPPWRRDNFSTDAPPMTLWVGASDSTDDLDHISLVQFYTIYLPDRKTYDSRANITEELVAFKGELDLCVRSYQSNITNGVTKTVEVDRATDLTWRSDFRYIDNNDVSVISTGSGG